MTKTFEPAEIEDIANGIDNFWHYQAGRGYLGGYRHKSVIDSLSKGYDSYVHKLSSRQRKVEFNQYGELKKRVVLTQDLNRYEVTGTREQLSRWEHFQHYGKECRKDKGIPDKQYSWAREEVTFEPYKNSVRDSLHPGVETFFLASADTSRSLVRKGSHCLDPIDIHRQEEAGKRGSHPNN